MCSITVNESGDTVIVDGGTMKERLSKFNTKNNKSYWDGKWDWETHPEDDATIIIRNVYIREHFDMGNILWFLTERNYNKIIFEESCIWQGVGKAYNMLSNIVKNSTREMVFNRKTFFNFNKL